MLTYILYIMNRVVIVREFEKNEDITITFIEPFYIDVLICGIHDWYQGVQAFMTIKYAPNLNRYDVANTILEKITDDLDEQFGENSYDESETEEDVSYGEPCYKDFIMHWDVEIDTPEIWNYDTGSNHVGSIWLPFTRENMKYVSIEKPHADFDISLTDGVPKAPLIIRGEVDADGVFTYDYPILGSCDTIEMYRESRGKLDYYASRPDHISGEIRRHK